MYSTMQKNRYRVVLDIEAYDDLDVQNLNWNEVLKLEGDESVEVLSITDFDSIYWIITSSQPGGIFYYIILPLNVHIVLEPDIAPVYEDTVTAPVAGVKTIFPVSKFPLEA